MCSAHRSHLRCAEQSCAVAERSCAVAGRSCAVAAQKFRGNFQHAALMLAGVYLFKVFPSSIATTTVHLESDYAFFNISDVTVVHNHWHLPCIVEARIF